MNVGTLEAVPSSVAPAPRSRVTTPDDAVLAGVAGLPAGQEVQHAGKTLLAGPLYHSASGKQCRTVMFTTGQGASYCRLACKSDSEWVWARSF